MAERHFGLKNDDSADKVAPQRPRLVLVEEGKPLVGVFPEFPGSETMSDGEKQALFAKFRRGAYFR